ncbi:amidohydrolase family protein [Streptomyces sp. WMMC500]|uniref:amidohydrolase family protein n=1 Tax=Streptomyces sp. WMMC500 TaxID=3015154 RepID=UPI00248B41DC|nr:amidohydrolase family protein [Streptomyces sp. WMMC500]WBB61701.1 amidohydrolase family protein [Streptomyces sp. WMMC500]
MDAEPFDLSRRRFLQATAAATGAAAAGAVLDTPAAAAPRGAAGTLTFTAATNGAAALAPAGDRLVAEVQSVLWSIPRSGGRATALTTAELEPTRPQFAPDGRRLVVCAYRGGGFHLWTLRPDGSGLTQVTEGPWDDRAPAWSPDGTRVAFCSERGGDPVAGSPYRIWVLDVATGGLTRVTGLPGQRGPHQGAAWEDFDPAWSPDGARLFFVRAAVGADGTLAARTVASVAADGRGEVRTEHTETTPSQVMAPAVGPGGRLAYLRTTAAPAASCTLVVDGAPVGPGAAGADVAPVPPRWISGHELLLTAGGRFRILDLAEPARTETIPFVATLPVDRPRYRAKTYDFADGGVRRVRAVHLPALSPDGGRLAFCALGALWIADVTGGGRPRRVLRAEPTRYVLAPAWTPDGRGLLYADDRDGLFAVRRRDLVSGEETVLAEGGRIFPALSPDGTRLACLDMTGNLVVRDLASGAEKVLAAPLGAGGLPGRPSWSPDGRRLALCDRNRLNRRFREGHNLIRLVDAATGAARLHPVAPHTSISDRYDSGPVWSPDGRWLAVVAESALWLLPVRPDGTPDGEPRQLTDEPADHPSFSGDGRRVAYLSAGRVRVLDVASGAARTVRIPLDYRRPVAPGTVVHAGRLWDGTSGAVRDDADVVIRRGRITAVEPHRAGRPAARRLDASARTVVPGLWDAHIHPWQSTYGGRQTALQLAYGITTAVSLGGFAYEQARVREAADAGDLAGPRLLATGELLDGARVAYSMGRAHRTRAGLRRSLARAEGLDWDFVKTYVRAPGWVMAEAAAFAHERLGVRTGSHLCSPGIQLGQDLTTHLQATQRLESGRATTASGRAYGDVTAIYTATGDFHLIATPFTALPLLGADPALAADPRVTVLMPPWDTVAVSERAGRPPTDAELRTLTAETDVYRRILAAGGVVALGTDQPLVPVGLHLHLALRALHGAGLSPAEALRTATVLPARAFGAAEHLGTLEPGKYADLTVIDGDPFTDFTTLVRTESVLRGGRPFARADLVRSFEPKMSLPAGTDWLEAGRRMRRDGCCDPER